MSPRFTEEEPTIAGLDYSLVSPAMAFHPLNKPWSIDRIGFVFFRGKAPAVQVIGNGTRLISKPTPVVSADMNSVDRYSILAEPFAHCMKFSRVEKVAMEDYAFAARGRVFHIGENGGFIKSIVHLKLQIPLVTVAPTVIKKFATGKGNSDKEAMWAAFFDETKLDIKSMFSRASFTKHAHKVTSPVSDMVDAYYICKWLYSEMKKEPSS